ncbi:hypothetical protein GCM10023114_01480 [Mycolicibacterium sediminis]|uniref:Trypsin n=1 Tax=Mycolicibacterium sediminis TaxID=1286180 RepID=A0A7I7QSY8_9MYCO|nr:hypothetical protein MSEDJ_35740 [Mycolicibacterium sediminis]
MAVVALALLTAACVDRTEAGRPTAAVTDPASAASASTETGASTVAPDRRVGAVFLGSETLHTCSGSVLDSAGGDLILTAAHCMADGVDAYFVPGYTGDLLPDDVWHVDAVYLDPRWLDDQNPLADFAIARVSRDGAGSLEQAVGGGLALGLAPAPGTDVAITGYELGIGGGPIGCRTATTAADQGFPSLPCAGMADGTSGSPWVSGDAVVGLTGGLDGGGCEDDVSFSPPFDVAISALLRRADQGGPGDDPPSAFDNGC